MPRYHFNIHDGVEIPDGVGVDLPNFNFARREAIRYAGALLEEAAHRESLGEEWRLEVTDTEGVVLFSLSFVVKDAAGDQSGG